MKTIIPILFVLTTCLLNVDAACCKKEKLITCCGRGPCNVFCCACKGGCNDSCHTDWKSIAKAGKTAAKVAGKGALRARGKRSILSDWEYFSSVDSDSDGFISLNEARSYLGHDLVKRDASDNGGPSWFSEMDSDGDGFISPSEFDHDLA